MPYDYCEVSYKISYENFSVSGKVRITENSEKPVKCYKVQCLITKDKVEWLETEIIKDI